MAKKLVCTECGSDKLYTDTSGWFCCSPCSQKTGKPLKIAKNPKAKPEKLKGNEFKFVNLTLSEGMKSDARLYIQNDFDFGNALTELMEEGYKVSFSCNLDNETFQCTISASYAGTQNSGGMLTGFAPDAHSAFGMAYYKHSVVLEKDWRKAMDNQVEKDKWG